MEMSSVGAAHKRAAPYPWQSAGGKHSAHLTVLTAKLLLGLALGLCLDLSLQSPLFLCLFLFVFLWLNPNTFTHSKVPIER